MGKNAIHVSRDEFVCLMALAGAEKIMFAGFEAEYGGFGEEDWERLWAECEESLLKKGYLMKMEGGVDLKPELALLIKECAEAERGIQVQLAQRRKILLDIIFYKAQWDGFICVESREAESEMYLSIQSAGDVSRMLTFIKPDSRLPLESGRTVRLTKKAYFSLTALLNAGKEDVAANLLDETLSDEELREFFLAVNSKSRTLVITVGEPDEKEEGMAVFFLGDRAYWLVYSKDENEIIFQHFTAQEYKDFIKDMIG